MKHEREDIAKQDRIKLMDQLKRKLSYKKEVVLQKHLSHQLNIWNAKQSQSKSIENAKRINMMLNVQKAGAQQTVDAYMNSSRSVVKCAEATSKQLSLVH